MEWTNSLALELLDLYQRHAILWDTTQKGHRDRHKRKDAYKDIACQLGRSAEDVESKINRLRSQYNRELSKEKHYESCGAIYKSRWFAFDIMANLMDNAERDLNADCSANARMGDTKQDNFQFLSSIDASQCIKVEQETIDLPGDEIDMDIHIAPGLHPMSPKKRAIEDNDSMSEVAKKSIKSSLQNEDALLPFGLYVASELNQLKDSHSLAMAKLKISQILFKAAMGAYVKTDQQQQQQMQLKNSTFVSFEEGVGANSTGTSPSVVEQKHVMSNLTLQDSVEDEFLNIS